MDNGVDKTLSKLDEMREHVTRYIKECPICQKLDYRAVKNHTTPFTVHSNAPMEVISADTIGPLPEDEFGNKFILVVIDLFTRFVELYAVKDQTAKYGAPQGLQSDKGSQFVNETIQELLKLVGSEHKTT